MRQSYKVFILLFFCVLTLIGAIGIGSVSIPFTDILNIFGSKWFSLPLSESIEPNTVSILWKIRIPRTFMAFLTGSALAVSGTVMQSVLKNPLASSYTLGVSSGATLGVSLIIVTGINLPFFGMFTLPFVGFLFGLGTVFLAIAFATHIDRSMSNQTIILVGLVLSLFVNAILTFITAFSKDRLKQLIFWQMGSFSGKEWSHVFIVFPIVVISIVVLIRYSREMDLMSFGEEQALSVGVELKKTKYILLGITALLTGTAVAFVGIIGFVDLIAPHIVRKLFGPSHRLALPMSALTGGLFLTMADLISRTILAPSELPVGAVTALIGAPFFAYIYFRKRK